MESAARNTRRKTRHLMQEKEHNQKRQENEEAFAPAMPAVRGEDRLQPGERDLRDFEHEPQDGGGKHRNEGKVKDLTGVMREEIAGGLEQQKKEEKRSQSQQDSEREFGQDQEVERIGHASERHIENAVSHDQKTQRRPARHLIDGIGRQDARSLLTYAFAQDVVDRIKVQSLRDSLERILFEKFHEHAD